MRPDPLEEQKIRFSAMHPMITRDSALDMKIGLGKRSRHQAQAKKQRTG